MKGSLAVETVLFAVILVLVLILLTWLFSRMIPAFGNFIDAMVSYTADFAHRVFCTLIPIPFVC